MTMYMMKNNGRADNMMKKITYRDTAILLGYKKNHLLERIACNHYLADETTCSVKAVAKVKWPVYIALFIPACIFQAVGLIWDGGLKEFRIEPRTIHSYVVYKDSKRYRNWVESDV